MPLWVVPVLRQLQERLDGAVALVSGRPLSGLNGPLLPWASRRPECMGVERRLSDGRIRVCSAELPSFVRQASRRLAQRNPSLSIEPLRRVGAPFPLAPSPESDRLLLLRAALLGAEDSDAARGLRG